MYSRSSSQAAIILRQEKKLPVWPKKPRRGKRRECSKNLSRNEKRSLCTDLPKRKGSRCTILLQLWDTTEQKVSTERSICSTVRSSSLNREICRFRSLGRRGEGLRSEEHTSELQSQFHIVCRLLLE